MVVDTQPSSNTEQQNIHYLILKAHKSSHKEDEDLPDLPDDLHLGKAVLVAGEHLLKRGVDGSEDRDICDRASDMNLDPCTRHGPEYFCTPSNICN